MIQYYEKMYILMMHYFAAIYAWNQARYWLKLKHKLRQTGVPED